MELERDFQSSAERVSSGQVNGICNDDLLRLYGLFSVVRKGIPPANGPSPYLDPRGSAKWQAWKEASDLTQLEAMRGYIALVDSILSKSGADKAVDTDTGLQNDAAIRGFDMVPLDGASSSLQRFDITHWASINDSKSVRFCLESQKVSPNYRDEAGLTALMRAADRNATDAIRLLVAAGADMNATDEEGQTALHYAALCDHEMAAGLLVSCGADPDLPDSDNATARDVAGHDALAAICAAACGEWIDVACLPSGERKSLYILGKSSVPTPLLIGAGLAGLLAVALIVLYNIGHS